jgi:L,D-peptidoglycan transpeptidase YkuD (ErfK/YbiS/YcfS/YnhG family)
LRIFPQYRYFAVIDYNAHPAVAGRGSAIFLHVSTGRPTAGCISLPEPELVRTLRWLRPGAEVRIGIS